MRPQVVLFGGMYGSGKSTVCRNTTESLTNRKTASITFDTLTDSQGNHIYETKDRWKVFLPEIKQKLSEGHEYVFAEASFHMRQTRDEYVAELSKDADVTGVFLMLPMKVVAERLRKRTSHEGRITNSNFNSNMRRFTNSFVKQDNTDLLLPTNREQLSLEYKALLSKKPENRSLLTRQDDTTDKKTWLAVTRDIDTKLYARILESRSPLSEQRRILEEAQTEGSRTEQHYFFEQGRRK